MRRLVVGAQAQPTAVVQSPAELQEQLATLRDAAGALVFVCVETLGPRGEGVLLYKQARRLRRPRADSLN